LEVGVTEPHRRRRRVRSDTDPAAPPVPSPTDLAALTSPVHDIDPVLEDREAERGLRGLVGGGSSQVSVTAALRARDATRPTDADLAASEANLIIIRRGWTPPPTPAR
jgi:hypothetical protein